MMYYIESESNDPRFNLALEQYVFDVLNRRHSYFMLWQNDSSIIIGKHQNTVAEINQEFVEKHSTTIYGKMDATTLNSAVNKACGANKQKFTLAFMHSDVATNLENMKLLEFMKQTDGDGIQKDLTLATWNGRTVVVDDDLPAVTGYADADADTPGALKIVASGGDNTTTIALASATPYFGTRTLAADMYVVPATQYTTYIMGNGAISYEDIGAKVPYEMARDPKTNGGVDTL